VAAMAVLVGLLILQGPSIGSTMASAFVPESAPDLTPEPEPASERPEPVVAPAPPAPVQLYARQQLDFKRLTPLPPERIDAETLWLARAIYSETKRREEQELVAWVVRNRVETTYRGRSSYRDVVLDPYQFSAFNPGLRTREFYSSLTPRSASPGWQTALRIAHDVRFAQGEHRPFPMTTRHFYSEQSMVGRKHPVWAEGLQPVTPNRAFRLNEKRFRFFRGIS
jgi:hypothetical protein